GVAGIDPDRFVGAPRQALPQSRPGALGAERGDRDLPRPPGLPDPEGLLQRVLVVGGNDPLDVGLVDGLSVGSDPDPGFRVGNVGDRDEGIHSYQLSAISFDPQGQGACRLTTDS